MKILFEDDRQLLVAELCHQINSPLAAIRNALYLAAVRTEDAGIHEYLALANDEISAIATILGNARELVEQLVRETLSHRAGASVMPAKKRAAA